MRRDEGPTDRAGRECPRTPALPARIAGRVRLPATQEGVSAGPDVFVGRDVSAGRSASAKRDAGDGFRASDRSGAFRPGFAEAGEWRHRKKRFLQRGSASAAARREALEATCSLPPRVANGRHRGGNRDGGKKIKVSFTFLFERFLP